MLGLGFSPANVASVIGVIAPVASIASGAIGDYDVSDFSSLTIEDTDKVTAWGDQNGGTSFVAAGSLRPAYDATGFKGQPCLTFSGAQAMNANAIANSFSGDDQAFAWFIVAEVTSLGNNDMIVLGSSSDADPLAIMRETSSQYAFLKRQDTGGSAIGPIGGVTATRPHLYSTYTDVAGTTATIDANNITEVSATIDVSNTTVDTLCLGARDSNGAKSFYSSMKVAQVILFDKFLTAEEIKDTKRALGLKWGVQYAEAGMSATSTLSSVATLQTLNLAALSMTTTLSTSAVMSQSIIASSGPTQATLSAAAAMSKILQRSMDAASTLTSSATLSTFTPVSYTREMVDFPGSAWLWVQNAMTGAVDTSKELTISMWFNRDSGTATDYVWSMDGGTRAYLYFGNPGSGTGMVCELKNAAGTKIFRVQVADSEFGDTTDDHHFVFSVDLTDTGKRHVYIDGTAASSVTWETYTNDTYEFTNTTDTITIGGLASNNTGATTASVRYDGTLGEIYVAQEYIDLSVGVNLAKFIDGSGNAVDLGSDGSDVTGTQPLMYLRGGHTTIATNLGLGENFTVLGTLTTA